MDDFEKLMIISDKFDNIIEDINFCKKILYNINSYFE